MVPYASVRQYMTVYGERIVHTHTQALATQPPSIEKIDDPFSPSILCVRSID